jgi:hypothetical protein
MLRGKKRKINLWMIRFLSMEKLASNIRSEALPEQPRKEIYLCAVDSLHQLPCSIKPTSRHFGLLIVMDAVSLREADLSQAAKELISKGLVYLCAWGPDCERVHDRFDEESVVEKLPAETDDVLMTTSHSDESLSEALWFFLNCAFATKSYEQTCADWIIATIGNERWEATIRADVALRSHPET